MSAFEDELKRLGTAPGDVADLAAAFPDADPGAWVAGLEACAHAMHHGVNGQSPPTAEPWGAVWAAFLAAPPGAALRNVAGNIFERWARAAFALDDVLHAALLSSRGRAAQAQPAAAGASAQPARRTRWTMAELMAETFPPLNWAVHGLVVEGLNTLSGRPKSGKSWLALQMAVAVASGGAVLGAQTRQGPVFMLCLEDSAEGVKNRLATQWGGAPLPITVETRWAPLLRGGLRELEKELGAGYALAVVDTIGRAAGRLDHHDYGAVTELYNALQHLAMDAHTAVLLIDHSRKPNGLGRDAVDDDLGSTGKAGAVDGILGLYRERDRTKATLQVRPRRAEETELALEWDALTCTWRSLGAAGAHNRSQAAAAVLDAIADLTDLAMLPTTTAIAAHTGMDPANVSRVLAELTRDGVVERGPKVGKAQPYYLRQTTQP